MFYDERIEGVKGRVSRNALIIAASVAGGSGLLRTITVIRNVEKMSWRGAYLFLPEVLICFGALLALLIGLCRGIGKQRDEMWQSEQAHFYNTAASLLLRVVVGAQVILLPFPLVFGVPYGYYGTAADAVLPVLLFVLGAYCIMVFRAEDVYLNYSILESPGYARGVAKNLGKAGLLLLGCLALSLTVCLMLSIYEQLPEAMILKSLLQLVVLYAMVAIALGGLYTLLSYLEWASFTRRRVVSPATVICLLLSTLIYVMYAAGVAMIDQLPISQSGAAILVNWISALEHPIRVLLLLFLTYFEYEYRRRAQARWIRVACRAMVYTAVATVVAALAYSGVVSIVMPEMIADDGYLLQQVMALFSGTVSAVEILINAGGFIVILLSLRQAGRIARGHIVAPFVMAVLGGVELFLFTQIGVLRLTLVHLAATAVLLLYACVVFASVRWEEGEEGAP